MNTIVGFITELTGEKRGPSKHYRRFNITTSNNDIIHGWVFSTIEIEDTFAGNILVTAATNNAAIQVTGKMSTESNNSQTIKISINNKFDKCINWVQEQIARPNITIKTDLIRDCLISNVPCRIEAVVLDEKDQVVYMDNQKEHRHKVFIIGDSSGTIPLLVYDELINSIQISESFVFNQIKSKKILNQIILTTTSITTIEKSKDTIIPDLSDIEQSMSFEQIDIEQLTCEIEEMSNINKDHICSSCKETLLPVQGKEHLLKCTKCSKYTLSKVNDIQSTITIKIDNQKSTFFIKKDILNKYFQDHNAHLTITNDNLSEYFLINGPWLLTVSHYRHELIDIQKNST